MKYGKRGENWNHQPNVPQGEKKIILNLHDFEFYQVFGWTVLGLLMRCHYFHSIILGGLLIPLLSHFSPLFAEMPQWDFSTVAFSQMEVNQALNLAIPVHNHPEADMVPDEIIHESPHSPLAQMSLNTDETNFSNSKNESPLQDVKSFGFLSLSVFPGYKRAYFDEETIIGFSEKILVPSGSHTLAIIAPEGYNDTSMTITISQGQTLDKTVRLRNKQTGRLAPKENKNTGSGGKAWLTWLRVGGLSVGVVASAFAYREMEYASDAQNRYRSAGVLENHNQLYNTYRDHIRMRNYLGIVSGVLISAGFVLWFF